MLVHRHVFKLFFFFFFFFARLTITSSESKGVKTTTTDFSVSKSQTECVAWVWISGYCGMQATGAILFTSVSHGEDTRSHWWMGQCWPRKGIASEGGNIIWHEWLFLIKLISRQTGTRAHTHIFKQGIVACTGVPSASLTAALLSKPCSHFSNCSERRSRSLHALPLGMAGLDSGCDWSCFTSATPQRWSVRGHEA